MNDQELDEPVYLRDKDLAGEAADFVNNIITELDKIMPFPRVLMTRNDIMKW